MRAAVDDTTASPGRRKPKREERRRRERRKAPDVLGRVDDLLDARHPQRDVHGGHPGEVEGLQGHLGARLPYALGAHRPHGRARLHLRPAGTDGKHLRVGRRVVQRFRGVGLSGHVGGGSRGTLGPYVAKLYF